MLDHLGPVAEVESKHRKVAEWMAKNGVSAVAFAKQNNFAWITGGRDNHVGIGTEDGATFAVLTREARYFVTSNSEGPRMAAEEMGELGFVPRIVPWYSGKANEIIQELAGGGILLSDTPIPGSAPLPAEVTAFRYSLTPSELERYRDLCAISSKLLEEACLAIGPGQTEHEIAGTVAKALLSEGIVPAVLLVAADDRLLKYRHPIPKDNPVERVFSVSIMAKKYGLQVAVTRGVAFGSVPEDLADRQRKVAYIDAVLTTETRAGRTGIEMWEIIKEAYKTVGWDGEWENHHQGGATGYAAREWVVFPGCPFVIEENQPIAWNPTIVGAKSEDTILATGGEAEILTRSDSDWPMIEVAVGGKKVQKTDFYVKD